MKKLLISALILGSMAVIPVAANTTSSGVAAVDSPQIIIRQNRRYRRGRKWTTITTRMVRRHGHLYRETIRVTHHRNGRISTKVIRRTRVGRY